MSSERPRLAGEMIWQEAYEAQPRKMLCPAPGSNNSMYQHRLGTERLENSLAEKDMGVLICANQPIKHPFDCKQWHAFGGESHCCTVSRLRKVILLFYTAPERLSGVQSTVLVSPVWVMGMLEQVWLRATGMMVGLQHPSLKEALRAGNLPGEGSEGSR